MLVMLESSENIFLRWSYALGRFTRCERTHIGDQIGQRHINFLPDGRNNRDLRSMDRADDHFFIEAP